MSKEEEAEHYRIIKEIMDDIRLTRKRETAEEKKLKTLYDEGFYLKGVDEQMRIGGWWQGDYRHYLDEGHPGYNTFLTRRALFDVRGILENDFAYRLYATFMGQRNGILQEGWLEYRKLDFLRFRAGQFTEPFSLEGIYSARWTDFTERAMIVNALAPFEDIGVMAFGKVLDGRIDYALGYFNGQGRNTEAVSDNKELTGRLVLSPFADAGPEHVLKGLYIGGSYGTGDTGKDLGSADIKTQAFSPIIDYQTGTAQDGRFDRWGAELEYLFGPFSMKSEYLAGEFDRLVTGTQSAGFKLRGYYVMIGFVLTGEKAAQNAIIKPKNNFDPGKGGCGAWQVVARYQVIETNREPFNNGIILGTDRARSGSLGLNWSLNPHIRIQFDYDRAWFDDRIVVNGKGMKMENSFIVRTLFDF